MQAGPVADFLCELLHSYQKADNRTEESNSFHESGNDQHGALDFTRSFRLTGNGFHSGTTDTADTQTSADSSQTSTDCGTEVCQGKTTFLSSLQKNSQHDFSRLYSETKTRKSETAKESVVIVVVMFFHGSTDVAGRQDRKDVGLKDGYQQLDQRHKDGKRTDYHAERC